jgi:uncharacterized protein (DUF934 family)
VPLLKNEAIIEELYTRVEGGDALPDGGAVLVDLSRWQADRDALIARDSPVGVRLTSAEAPEAIAQDLSHLSLVALEFPVFTDGRAYSYARMLRERYGFQGEVRAVGDVLLEQLHFMHRAGFDCFEFSSDEPVEDWIIAQSDMKVWYQPTADNRATATQLRRR